MKSPQQQIFDAVFLRSLQLGYRTFDYVAPDDTAYPFVFVGEQNDQDQPNKTSIAGIVYQTVHVYHTHKERKELTTMMDNLKTEFRRINRTENFYVACRNITAQTIPDNTTATPLLHGIIEVEFKFH